MATLQELLEQKEALDRQIRDAQKSQREHAIAQVRKLMHDNNLTVADLANPSADRKSSKTSGGKTSRPVAPKYRHSQTGATWTGRGLKPRWLSEELSNGKTLADFAI